MDVRVGFLVAFLLLAGCVERKLWVRTDPPGAHVSINGEALGSSPVAWRFDHYGTVLVEARLPGHEPAQQAVRLRSPWYQKPVLDFVTDVLLPFRIRDEHEVTLALAPQGKPTREEIRTEVAELTEAARRAREAAERE